MSLERFHLLDIKPNDNSIVKRNFLKVYHQQAANLNHSDRNVEFFFGENNTYDQIGNFCLEFDIIVRGGENAKFTNNSSIRLTNNAFAYVCIEGRLPTTSGGDLEHNKFCGQVSTILRTITSKDRVLLSQFDNINEGNGDADFDSTF